MSSSLVGLAVLLKRDSSLARCAQVNNLLSHMLPEDDSMALNG